jgi:plastocyanin
MVIAVAAAPALTACGSSSQPTTPPASVAAPPPASSGPVPGGVDPTPVGGVSEAPGVRITARNIDFEPKTVTVPANVPLTLEFDNQDAGIPHGLQVSDANGNAIFKSEIVNGPKQLAISLPALGPATYTFMCPVHPNMTGTITAE